jgi:hypothetical protein
MKRNLVFLSALLMMACIPAVASSLCANNATLQSYITGNDTFINACQIGDKLFWGFSLTNGPGALGFEPTAAQIQVQPVPGDGLTNVGISFNTGGWVVSSSIPIDQILSYNVATVTGDALIKDATLTITGSLTGTGGSGSVQETLTPAVAGSPLTASLPSTLSINIDFSATKMSTLAVSNRITLLGGRGIPDLAHISVFENDFSEAVQTAPEPMTAGPLGAGLLLFGLAGRKLRQRGWFGGRN